MNRIILAYLAVDEDRAFKKSGGPIEYLLHKAVAMERSGIFLEDAAIVDDDADDPKERYLVYLARFAFDHLSDGNAHPMTFDEWVGQGPRQKECDEMAISAAHGRVSQRNEAGLQRMRKQNAEQCLSHSAHHTGSLHQNQYQPPGVE